MSTLKFLGRLAIGALLVAYLLFEHEVSASEVAKYLRDLPILGILAALALDLAGQTLSSFRWARLAEIAGHPVRFGTAWKIYFSGMFFNTCLPTSIGGDVVRVVGLSKYTRSKSVALASVFMDRNVGMAALLSLGLLSALLAPVTIQITISSVSASPLVLPLWPLFLLLIAGYVLANVLLFGRRIYRLAERLVFKRLPGKVHGKIEKLHRALQSYRRPLHEYAWTYVLSLAYQASEAALVWVLARGMGLDLPFWVFAAMVLFQAVAGLLPISINNIGVRDAIFCAVLVGQAALHRHGMTEESIKGAALALSTAYLCIVMISGMAGGIVYLVAGVPKPTEADLAENVEFPAAGALTKPTASGS
ncbi:MAG: flippase-like domain-containing protein [Planctomycetota bacterium]|nr:flippase-like domain-containing protein [Planctomycetota bacterium]